MLQLIFNVCMYLIVSFYIQDLCTMRATVFQPDSFALNYFRQLKKHRPTKAFGKAEQAFLSGIIKQSQHGQR